MLLVENGGIQNFDGDLNDYSEMVLSRRRGKEPTKVVTAAPVVVEKRIVRPAKNLHKMIQNLNATMLKLQEKIGILDQALSDTMLYKDAPQKAADYAKLRNKLADELIDNENQWLELNEELEHA